VTTPSYRETRWGQACVAIHVEMAKRLPSLALNVGPDEAAQTQAPPLVTFQHAGETAERPLRGGGGRGAGNAWDRPTMLAVEIWGSTPAEADGLYESLLLALNVVAHLRASKPGAFKPMVGSSTSGNLGAKMIGTITVRFALSRPARTQVASTIGVVAGVKPGDAASEEVILVQ
jgi:hypothetical protein